ncbi:MAG: TadE/TadG family type IV pilus assembly protein [Clostridiales bacterium]|nr:TadE/TadG family type IV pilus assembly protein [Clostridiales bacterium]
MKKQYRFIIKRFRDEDGQSALEFAIVLPILLLLVCGIIEFGLLFNMQLTLDHCAREGVRYAAIHSNESDIEQVIADRVDGFALMGDADVAVVYSETSHRRGDVTVTVHAVYKAITPIGKLIFSSNEKLLSCELTMKVE